MLPRVNQTPSTEDLMSTTLNYLAAQEHIDDLLREAQFTSRRVEVRADDGSNFRPRQLARRAYGTARA
jgi:hypothetical protein